MYREEILEHWRNPLNFGVIDNADLVIEQINPLCGDEVTFYFKLSKPVIARSDPSLRSGQAPQSKKRSPRFARDDRLINDVRFTGNGCAISIAVSSMLSNVIKGKKVKELGKLTGQNVLELIGGEVAPARLKCVFLSLEVVRKMTQTKEVVLDKLEQ